MAFIKRPNRKNTVIAVVIILIVGGIVLYFVKHKNTETIHVAATGSTAKKSESSKTKSSDKTIPSSNNSPASNSSKGTSPSSVSLQAPFGTLVSNHAPSLSGSPQEESVCNTSPGATCYIAFTNGNTVKQLPTQTADSSGTVYWSWDVKQAGLSSGKWQIQAFASLNGQTKSTQDNLGLNVGQ